jgi:hypothetical protein
LNAPEPPSRSFANRLTAVAAERCTQGSGTFRCPKSSESVDCAHLYGIVSIAQSQDQCPDGARISKLAQGLGYSTPHRGLSVLDLADQR